MTVMYLMTISSLSFEEALSVVQYCREVANPNLGFRMQLKKYEESTLEEVCVCVHVGIQLTGLGWSNSLVKTN